MLSKELFGTTSYGVPVTLFRITNQNGISVAVLNYGCTLQSVCLPHHGAPIDVCLGYDTIEAYETNDGYLGAMIGRYAGRIPDAALVLDAHRYLLCRNDGVNHLHGGRIGFDRHVFRASTSENSVEFSYTSPNLEEGYPSTLSVTVRYTLTENDTLRIECEGIADGLTVWNPTNHAYWNLNGHDSGSVLSHTLRIAADRYVPVDRNLIALGYEKGVDGTPYDFRTAKQLSDGFLTNEIRASSGYDHCFVFSEGEAELKGNCGIRMQIRTDCKAVQVYTANFLSERFGKHGAVYRPHDAICLETESRPMMRIGTIPEESQLFPFQRKTHCTEFRFIDE